MSHSTIERPIGQVAVFPRIDVDTSDHGEAFVPTAEDLADYRRWLSERDEPGQAEGPTPLEALAEPWWLTASHDPELDDVRYVVLEEPELFGLPVGAERLPETDLDLVDVFPKSYLTVMVGTRVISTDCPDEAQTVRGTSLAAMDPYQPGPHRRPSMAIEPAEEQAMRYGRP